MKKIVIAPGWYKEGILNTCILPLLAELTAEDYEIWIRPHPEFAKRNKNVYQQLVKQSREKSNIYFDQSPSVYTHLVDAAHLITDRSGIALEYALATNRPVLFIDTPLKIQNPNVTRFSIVPLENIVRGQIGEPVAPDAIHPLRETLQKLKRSADHYRTSIQEVENRIVFTPSHWQNGVQSIEGHLRR